MSETEQNYADELDHLERLRVSYRETGLIAFDATTVDRAIKRITARIDYIRARIAAEAEAEMAAR